MSEKVEVFVLLADGNGCMCSRDEPFGVAVRTEEEAKKFVKVSGGSSEFNWGYTQNFMRLRVFDTVVEALAWTRAQRSR